MKVSSETVENSQVALNIEAEDADLDKYLKVAYNHLVGRVAVPGFRKGKTPRPILEKHIGKDAFLREAMEHLIPELYEAALVNEKIEAIDRPEIEVLQTEPVKFKAVVPLRPKVTLGNYKLIRIAPPAVEITDEEVDKTVDLLRQQHATLIPVERPVQFGDIVTIDVEGEHEGKAFLNRKETIYEVTKESFYPLPGFAEKLEGLNKGIETNFALSYPQDYTTEQLRGKEYKLQVKVTEIKEKKLPELNDEFAKTLDQADVSALKTQLKTNLKTAADERARRDFEQKCLDAAVEMSDAQYPPIMKEREIERLVQDDARNFPDGAKGLEKYLKNANKPLPEYRKELEEVAQRRLVRSLVLGKIAETENAKVEDVEIDAEIEKMVAVADKQAENMRKILSTPQSRESIGQVLLTQRTLKILTDIASGAAAPEKTVLLQ